MRLFNEIHQHNNFTYILINIKDQLNSKIYLKY